MGAGLYHGVARMLAKRSKDAYAKAFRTAVEVINVSSGHVVSMLDDGVDSSGAPVRGRVHLQKKLAMRDEAGDPIFVLGECIQQGGEPKYVFREFPRHMIGWDTGQSFVWPIGGDTEKERPPASTPITAIARTARDMSVDPRFAGKTLGDKALANRRAHEAREREQQEQRLAGLTPHMVMPPELATMMKSLGEAAAQAQARASTRSREVAGAAR